MEAMFDNLPYGEGFVHNSKFSVKRLAAVYISDDPIEFDSNDTNGDTNTDKSDASIMGYSNSWFFVALFISIIHILRFYHKREA